MENAAAAPKAPRRRRQSHSMEAILATSVELLDADGAQALTFRELANRLGGGVGSFYWYVASKDELLDRATDEVLGQLLSAEKDIPDEPIAALRELGGALYATMQQHPWVASYLMRNVELQPNAMRLYELLGQQTLKLELTPRQRFHAVSTLIGYVTGVGAELTHTAGTDVDKASWQDRENFLEGYADRWRALDADDYPFVHQVADEFEHHRDEEQFMAGLDLMLAGLALQAGRRT